MAYRWVEEDVVYGVDLEGVDLERVINAQDAQDDMAVQLPEAEAAEEVVEDVNAAAEKEMNEEVELAAAILKGQEEVDEIYFTPPSSPITIFTQSQLTLEDLL